VWVGCPTRGRRETDAVFEVREKEVQFESVSADETAWIFGVGEIETIRGRVRWCGCPMALWMRNGGEGARDQNAGSAMGMLRVAQPH
jgi:hypothetical protein